MQEIDEGKDANGQIVRTAEKETQRRIETIQTKETKERIKNEDIEKKISNFRYFR